MLLSTTTRERPVNKGTHISVTHSLTCQVRRANGGFWGWVALQRQHVTFHCSDLLFLFCTRVSFHLILHHMQTLAANCENFIWLAIFIPHVSWISIKKARILLKRLEHPWNNTVLWWQLARLSENNYLIFLSSAVNYWIICILTAIQEPDTLPIKKLLHIFYLLFIYLQPWI